MSTALPKISDLFDLTGKSALVTGGTGSLGSIAAKALAAAENLVEQAPVLRPSRAGRSQRNSQRGCFDRARFTACRMSQAHHGYRGMAWTLDYHTNPYVQIVTDGPQVSKADLKADSRARQSMIPKSGHRFSEKIMLHE